MIKIELNSKILSFTSEIEFDDFLRKNNLSIDADNNIVETSGIGVIPEILSNWFAERKEYRRLMLESGKAGDKEKEAYYDRRQHVQKIFLNSIYGALGLPVFRFYDLDNALAVTATGQDVIKTSAKFLNGLYNKGATAEKDYCIYIDTDSLYFSAIPMFSQWMSTEFTGTEDESVKMDLTIKTAQASEVRLNQMYDKMAKNMFFVTKHRFKIKGEKIAKTALWVAKKRYALWTVYDLEKNVAKEKLVVKGLDVVRSSFPPAFAKFMTHTLHNILKRKSKDDIDQTVIDFLDELKTMDYVSVSRNTSITNGLAKYDDKKQASMLIYKKGVPLHVKSAIAYNRYLKSHKLDKKHAAIRDGAKIKYVYLRQPNPLGVDAIAFKGYDDPKELIALIKEYIDGAKLFENEMQSKLEDFYSALGWGRIPTKTNLMAGEFFSF